MKLVAFDAQAKGSDGQPLLVLQEDTRRSLLEACGNRAVRVVVVCGLYRTGKSLLLNLLAGVQGASERFAVGNTVQACTDGIWAWPSKPLASDGSVCVLLDCEGSGNTQRDREHDARLFAVAVLISSCLIFNSRGVINESSIQALAVAASLAQRVHQQNKDRMPGVDLAPHFIWVLRDFTLALEDAQGKPITSKDYLEQTLSATAGNDRRDDLKDARDKIKDLFARRDCTPLVIPVVDEDKLGQLGDLPLSDLRPAFVEQVTRLRADAFGREPLKSLSGDAATGSVFLLLLHEHIDAMNTGVVPQLGSVWQHVTQQQCGQALDESLRAFSAQTFSVASSLPMADEDLDEQLQRARSEAQAKFTSLALGDAKSREEYRQELDQSISSTIDRLKRENLQASNRADEAWLKGQWDARIESKLKAFRLQHDAGSLTVQACDEAESLLKAQLSELRSAFEQNATVPREDIQQLWESIAERRAEALTREISSWRTRSAAAADVKSQAQLAADEERAKLEAGGRALAESAKREVDESRKRTEAMQEGKDPPEAQPGQQSAAPQEKAKPTVTPEEVEVKEADASAGKAGKAGKADKAAPKKGCCAVQ